MIINSSNIYTKTLILTIALVISSIVSYSQSIQSISGQVVNTQGENLFGNAVLLSPLDSSILKGTSFLEGSFRLQNLKEKEVLIKLTSLEFGDKFINLEYDGREHINLGKIVAEQTQTMLNEIAITAESPLVIEKTDGSLEVTVANTALASSISTDEILSKSPGIVYNADGEIGIFGKGAAILFINGIRVTNDRLSTIAPTDIDKIEIISNPGPRYDAEGNAVINIITKKGLTEGSKGMIKNYTTYSDFAGYQNRTDVNYSYSKGKLSLNSNYGLLVGNNRRILETTRTRNQTEDYFNSDIKTEWQYEYDNFSNYGFGAQYDINSDSYISLQYTGAYEDLGGRQLSDNTITYEEVTQYSSTIDWDDITSKNTINANYNLKTDSLGSNLFIGGQYASYTDKFDNSINESNTLNGVESKFLINNIGENNTQIFSAQLDYTKVLDNNHTIELGGKYGYVNIYSNTTFLAIDEQGTPTKNEDLSSNFEYDEKIPAAYANFKGNLNENVNYSIGVRSELTNYTLYTSVDDGRVIKDNYINVFPNASLTIKLSDDISTYFTYASRIIRAPYNRLNPFVIYQDAFTSIQGNPNLQPSKVHAIELGGSWQGWSLKTGYTYTIDPMDGGAFQSEDNPKEYILQRTNVSRGHGYFASLSKNISVKSLRSINTATISYDNLIDESGVFGIGAKRPYYYLYSQNSIDLENWVTLFVTAWYLSDMQDGINFEKNYSSINIGLEKKLFNDAFKFNLDFNDVFHKVRASGEYTLGETYIIYANTFNTNYIRFSLSYNFGKLKKSNYQNKDIGKSETQRAG